MLSSGYISENSLLLVDDDEFQRDLMKLALEDLGLDFLEATNGAEAVEIFEAHHPLLVVMDINMPVMDGFAACKAMRALPGGENAAIIMVTGLDDISEVQQAFDLGAMEFITKPLDLPMFRMRVQYILRIQQSYLQVQNSREKMIWAQHAAAVGGLEMDLRSGNIWLSDEALHVLSLKPNHNVFDRDRVWPLVLREDKRPLLKAYAKLLRFGDPVNLDIRLACGGNQILHLHIFGEITMSSLGNHQVISGTIQDITKRKLAEEKILEIARLKHLFLANMSHELRTPVSQILGLAELLEDTTLNDVQYHWVDSIQQSSRHLVSLLNSVLDFAALESGNMNIAVTTFDLAKLMESIHRHVADLAQTKGLSLSMDLDGDIPHMVQGDAARIRQVILGLANNACKFTEQGHVLIRVALENLTPSRCQVRFSVKDTGPGIPLHRQKDIFEKFVQAEESLTRKHGGTGLGLAICKKLVELMGGKLLLSSQEGQGTDISFVLPLEVIEERALGVEPTDVSECQILLVEDNLLNQLIAKKILERKGFSVDVAENGQVAVTKISVTKYDAVLMDCQMPVMDGYEATRYIRNMGTANLGLPIIALTAHALAGEKEKCFEAGMNDFLTKPASGEILYQTLKKWVPSKLCLDEPQVQVSG